MKQIATLFFLVISYLGYSQEITFTQTDLPITKFIDGTLLTPNSGSNTLAIIIAGSGPTDRDGNQNFLKTSNLKKLAVNLTNNGIATFRYDKRIVKQIRKGNVDPNIMFDNFVSDAIDVVLDKIKDMVKKDLERGKVDSLNKLGKLVKVKASGVENKPGRHIVTLNQEFTMDEREDTTTKE